MKSILLVGCVAVVASLGVSCAFHRDSPSGVQVFGQHEAHGKDVMGLNWLNGELVERLLHDSVVQDWCISFLKDYATNGVSAHYEKAVAPPGNWSIPCNLIPQSVTDALKGMYRMDDAVEQVACLSLMVDVQGCKAECVVISWGSQGVLIGLPEFRPKHMKGISFWPVKSGEFVYAYGRE